MRISTPVKGPSLAEVISFTILEDAESVARVEQAAARRLRSVRKWTGWRVWAVDIQEGADELARVLVHCDRVGTQSPSDGCVLEFMTDEGGQRQSRRFGAFLRACGVTERVDATREIEGRYFASRNNGRATNDFGPLALAIG